MRRARAVTSGALAVALLLTAASATATESHEQRGVPVPGGSGIGDDYWPLDGNGGIDVEHYDIEVAYDFGSGELTGTTTVTLRALDDLAHFHLDLLLTPTAVSVGGVPAGFEKVGPHELEVVPDVPVAAGTTVDVDVSYEGVPGEISYAGESNWLADDREVVTMNEPHMAPWWFAANDHPSDKALFDITVTGPATHQVVSNGALVDRSVQGATATTHWRSAHPMATYLAFFALGRYRIEQTVRDRLPSYVAVSRELPPQERQISLQALRGSDEVTAWLQRRLGRYPFESTGGLATSLEVGFALENQTRPTYPAFQGTARFLVVHELAHQWFGDSVSVRRWRDIWLAEGFATFMEVASLEDRGGRTGRTWLRTTYADRRADRDFWRIDLTDPGAHRIFADAVYTRGGMTLQALRNRIGDRLFWTLLRTWVKQHRYGNATVGAFRRLAAEVAGEPLDGFFDAWLEGRRPPAQTRANGLR